jgi:hypothetical protein
MYIAVQPDLDFEPKTNHPQPRVGSEQNSKILSYMLLGNSISAYEALQLFGCFRLAARIHDIRKMGYAINKETMDTQSGKKVAVYSIGGAHGIRR